MMDDVRPSRFRTLIETEMSEVAASGRTWIEDWPVGYQAVELRVLPPPFNHFFTLASDCDGPRRTTKLRAMAVGTFIREKLGLPIADSFFADGIYLYGIDEEASEHDHFVPLRFLSEYAEWLRAFHEGWFDVVHGWIQQLTVRITDDFILGGSDGPRERTLRFIAPPGWQQIKAPRYLAFRARLPLLAADFRLEFLHRGTVLHTINSARNHGVSGMNFASYLLDLWPILGRCSEILHGLEVRVRMTDHEDSRLEMRDACLISDTRADILRQRNALERLNVSSSTLTSHGIGAIIGAAGMPDSRSADPRCLADRRENPHYCVDLLREHGIEFFNSFHNTTQYQPQSIDQLVFPRTLADGEVVYDFNRYSYMPCASEGNHDDYFRIDGRAVDPSFADCIGRQIRGFLGECRDRSGTGGLLYTHTGVADAAARNAPHEADENVFNDETLESLHVLADRYLNLSGEVEDGDRVFLSTTSVLLRMAHVRRELPYRAAYDPQRNIVDVRSWFDPIVRRRVPNPGLGARELRCIPFYVDSASTARIFLDGEEIPWLIRYPADETGRQSVSVADISAPKGLLGAIPLSGTGTLVQTDGVRLFESTRPDGVDGVVHQVQLLEERGAFAFDSWSVSIANMEYLGVCIQRDDPALKWRLELKLDSEMKLACFESGFSMTTGASEILTWPDHPVQTVLVPIRHLLTALDLRDRRPLTGRVQRVTLLVEGSPGATMQLNWIRLFRDDERPRINNGHLIGGTADTSITSVELLSDGRRFDALISASGAFFFSALIAAGSLVVVRGYREDGTTVAPIGGELVEVLSDRFDLHFS